MPLQFEIVKKVKICVTFSSDTQSRSATPLQIWKTNSLTDGPHKVYSMCSVGGSGALGEKQDWIFGSSEFLNLLLGRSHKLIAFIYLTRPDTLNL